MRMIFFVYTKKLLSVLAAIVDSGGMTLTLGVCLS